MVAAGDWCDAGVDGVETVAANPPVVVRLTGSGEPPPKVREDTDDLDDEADALPCGKADGGGSGGGGRTLLLLGEGLEASAMITSGTSLLSPPPLVPVFAAEVVSVSPS